MRKCGTLQFDDGPDQSWAAINSVDSHPAYIRKTYWMFSTYEQVAEYS